MSERKDTEWFDGLDEEIQVVVKAGRWLLRLSIIAMIGIMCQCGVKSYIQYEKKATHVYEIRMTGKCDKPVLPLVKVD